MTDVTVNDQFTLDAANKASAYLKAVEGLLNEAERLLTLADAECDLETDTGHLEDLQAAVVVNANAVNEAINKYVQGG